MFDGFGAQIQQNFNKAALLISGAVASVGGGIGAAIVGGVEIIIAVAAGGPVAIGVAALVFGLVAGVGGGVGSYYAFDDIYPWEYILSLKQYV